MAELQTISLNELQTRLKSASPLHFWNVLTNEWFKGEMIPGSRRVPLDTLGRETSGTHLAKDAELVVYCGGPKCPQSRLAAEKLTAFGFTKVRAFEGGIEEWKGAGLPIVSVDLQAELSAA